MSPDTAIEEFKCIGEFMRHYATLRLYRLTLLLGTTGGIISGICSEQIQARGFVAIFLLKLGALVISLAFTVMDYRAGEYWHLLRERANALAGTLQFQQFPLSSPWSPLTSIGAGRCLHVFIMVLWFVSLFFGW